MKLSIIILTRNEAKNLKDCIASTADLADEIIVIDGESTDNTVEVAKSLNAKVVIFDKWQGYGPRRQDAQKHAGGEWILHLDADERLTPQLVELIKNELSKASGNEIFAIPRATYLLSHRINHCGWYPDYVLRLYKNSYTHYDDALVHEKLEVPKDAKIIYLKEPMIHYSYHTLEQYFDKQKTYELAFGENKFKKGKKVNLLSIPFRALFGFIRIYFIKKGFLDGKIGLWLAISVAAYVTNKYLALYMAQNNEKLK